jgi:hypothetical protein
LFILWEKQNGIPKPNSKNLPRGNSLFFVTIILYTLMNIFQIGGNEIFILVQRTADACPGPHHCYPDGIDLKTGKASEPKP